MPALALVMCAKVTPSTGEVREGTSIKLREACKPTEQQLDPFALGLQGPAGPQGSPGADGTDGLDGLEGPPGPTGATGPGMVALDANGLKIGVAELYSQTGLPGLPVAAAIATVEIDGSSRTVWGAVNTQGFSPYASPEQDFLYYTTLDCTGQAYIGGSSRQMAIPAIIQGPMDPQAYISGPGTTAYFVSGPAPSAPIATRSRSYAASTPANCPSGTITAPGVCCVVQNSSAQFLPTSSVDLSGFVPPFRIETP